MSSLTPRYKEFNDEIQWERSKGTQTKQSFVDKHRIELELVFVFVMSFIAEYWFSYGSLSLFILVSIIVIYEISAKNPDNLPMGRFYPILGNLIDIFRHFDSLYDRTVEVINEINENRNGEPIPLLSSILPFKRTIALIDPVLVDLVYRKKFGDAVKDPTMYQVLDPILGNGIFSSNGKIWKKHRAIASRMFTTRSLRDYMFVNFLETTNKLMVKLDELSEKNSANGVDMYNMFSRLTFEAFTNTAFGVNVNAISSAPDLVPFATAFDRTAEICFFRYFAPPFFWKTMKYFDIGFEKELRKNSELMESFIQKVIAERKEYYQNLKLQGNSGTTSYRDRYDLLSMFIKDNPDIDNKELRDITMNFIIAGRDTTAQLLSWFMYEMTRTRESSKDVNQKVNIDAETKIRKEIDTVLAKYKNQGVSDGISYQSMNELKYLEAALLESLRLHPSVPNLGRQALIDFDFGKMTGDKKYDGYIIRKGNEIIVGAYAMGRMKWIWGEDTSEFKPERFYDEKNNKIIEYSPSKIPSFNLNPRYCLGKNLALLEAKIAIASIFTRFKDITIVPNQNVTYTIGPTLQMKNGIKVMLK